MVQGWLWGLYTSLYDGNGSCVPEWSPVNETHLLHSTSVIQNVSYAANGVSYTTYDGTSTEVLHMSFNPVVVTADGLPLQRRTDLNQPGWVLDVATKTLRIYHTGATQIVISSGEANREVMTELYTNNSESIMLENGLTGNMGPVFNGVGKSEVPDKNDNK